MNRKSRSRIIALIDTNTEEKLEVTVSYQAGGMSMWDYKNHARGYYLSVGPIKIETSSPYTTKSFTLGSGLKTLIQEANRFGQKALDKAVNASAEILPDLITAVCKKHGLTVIEKKGE